ncbi:hypothetical protein N7454_003422 [Penicillium verhagenii]|nr:hypothetical protein N7454_003422 [Penicillium verhagenii]
MSKLKGHQLLQAQHRNLRDTEKRKRPYQNSLPRPKRMGSIRFATEIARPTHTATSESASTQKTLLQLWHHDEAIRQAPSANDIDSLSESPDPASSKTCFHTSRRPHKTRKVRLYFDVNPPDHNRQISIRWILRMPAFWGTSLRIQRPRKLLLEGGRRGKGPEELFPWLAVVVKHHVRRRITEAWALLWVKEKTGKPNQGLVPIPHMKTLKLVAGVPTYYTTMLVQMRSMRVALNHFLFKIKEIDSVLWGCLEDSQAPQQVHAAESVFCR